MARITTFCAFLEAVGLSSAYGAMVFFLRKVVWTVPDFTVDRYRERLRDLHDQIDRDGVFHSTMSRTLFEVRKPPA